MNDEKGISSDTIVVDINPDSIHKRKIERNSGQYPAKVKLTGNTFASLFSNVVSSEIKKVVKTLNERLSTQRKAIFEAETRKVDEEENKVNEQKKEEENVLDLAFQIEERISKAMKPDIVNASLEKCGIQLTEIRENQVKAERKDNKKAIIVKRVLAKYCERLGLLRGLYNKKQDKPVSEPKIEEEQVGANWQNLFEEFQNESNDTSTPVIVENEDDAQVKITNEELKRRNLISEIGKELSRVRQHLRNFKDDSKLVNSLKERESSLLKMLSDVIDFKYKSDKEIVIEKPTEMQMLIDEKVGYTAPLTENEYREKAADLEAYYQDPTVGERMHNLMFKDILFGMNENAMKIDEAERTDDYNKAQLSGAVDVIDVDDQKINEDENVEKNDEMLDLRLGAETQAALLFQKSLKEWANEQARELYAAEQKANLVNGAAYQASLLHKQNRLLDGARAQADLLYKRNQNVDLLNGANEQASELYKAGKNANLADGASEQASLLYEQNRLLDGAKTQADLLYKNNQKVDFLNEARKQASLLHERNSLLDGASKQAKLLHGYNQKVSLLNGAEEQASMLLAKSPSVETVVSNTERVQPVMTTPVTPSVPVVSKPAKIYEISDYRGRYGNLDAPSKPIKVTATQLGSFRKNGRPSERDILVSLISDLNSFDEPDLAPEQPSKGISRVAA